LDAPDDTLAATVALTEAGTRITEVMPRPGPSLAAGSVLGGRYEILKLLGQGGMGAVYKAMDRDLERPVALKVIRPEMAADPGMLKRFKQELILARQISHPNIIQIHDLGTADGIWFISMELVSGRDLGDVIRERHKLPPGEAVAIIAQVCYGLRAAHAENVVHRDLKPSNVMIQDDGGVTVMDFGLARSADMASDLTHTGVIMGTPVYMSPEQASGLPADSRSDIFSVGVIFYELLTDTVPFKAESAMATLLLRCREAAVPPVAVDPSVPKSLSDIVVKALATDPADRYPTVDAMLEDLDHWQAERQGPPPPSRRRRITTAAWKWISIAVALGFMVEFVWYLVSRKGDKPAVVQKPIIVLVADFDNNTADPLFDGTLEPTFSIGLEGASFIASYDRGTAHRVAKELQPSATHLDLGLARLVSVREGISAVVAGSVDRDNGEYRLSMKLVDAVSGRELLSRQSGKISKDAVLAAVAKLILPVRKSLGDVTSEAIQLAFSETFTSSSLDAVHSYALAQERQWMGKQDEAAALYLEALRKDPDFGRAYAGLAAIQKNVGHREEAEKYYREAIARTSHMTDREKYRTRGGYFLMKRDDYRAFEEFSDLVKEYPSDTIGLANLALVSLYRRDMVHAVDAGRRASEIYPKNVIWLDNFALYLMYSGDFALAEQEAQKALGLNPSFERAFAATALSQLAQGQVEKAAGTWKRVEKISKRGASWSALGLADMALYQGRAADAASILEKGIAADDATHEVDAAAIKRLALASLRLDQGKAPEAVALADRATASKEESVRYTAARIYARAHKADKARPISEELGSSLPPEARSYSGLIEGELALQQGDPAKAVGLFLQARKLADTWPAHFLLGRGYLDAGSFSEALTEFDNCLKRRGEVTAAFLDEMPTYRYLPPVYYYKGRAEEALKKPAAAESYRAFLAAKTKAEADPMVTDAKRRLAAIAK
jgi:tetratricopeptide (TPR) repeat protein